MKLIVKKTKLGYFFTMTKGYWNNSRTNYKFWEKLMYCFRK